MEVPSRAPDNGYSVVDLFRVARAQNSFSGVNTLLHEVAKFTQADGVVLWLPVFPQLSPRQWIFAAASHFEALENDAQGKNRAIFLEYSKESLISRLIDSGEAGWFDLGLNGLGVDPQNSELESKLIIHFDLKHGFCVPLRPANTADPRVGALVFYRCGAHSKFSQQQEHLCRLVGEAWPDLHHCLTEAVGYSLLRALDIKLEELDGKAKSLNASLDDLNDWLHNSLLEKFNAREVGIYFENFGAFDRVIRRRKSTWPWKFRIEPPQYRSGQGITGTCYRMGRMINISDVVPMETTPFRAYWDKTFPGARSSPVFDSTIARLENLPQDAAGNFAPVAVVAVPITFAGRAIGVIRCAARSTAPYYFGRHEEIYLTQIASRVSQFLGLRLAREQQEREVKRIQAVVSVFVELANRVEKSGSKALLGYAQLVESARHSIPQTELARLWIPKGGEAASLDKSLHGDLGAKSTSMDHAPASPRRGLGTTRSWRLYLNNLEHVLDGRMKGESISWPSSPLSPEPGFNSIVSIPIFRSDSELDAVLELQSRFEEAYSLADAQIGLLMVRMIQFCKKLGRSVEEAREAEKRERDLLEAYYRAVEDLAHQARTPTYAVRRWAALLMKEVNRPHIRASDVRELTEELSAMGLRSTMVVKRMRVFVDLAKEGVIHDLQMKSAEAADLEQRLGLVRLVILSEKAKERSIKIEVDWPSCRLVQDRGIRWDPDLLEQCLEVILENAVKYGDIGSLVKVRCGVDRKQSFYVAVENKGTRLHGDEVKNLKDRGTRMDQAVMKGTKGTGLGLYLAASMMRQMGGEVEAIPTTWDGITEFRLKFLVAEGL